MAPPLLVIVPFLARSILSSWQCHRIDRERRRLNGRVGRMTGATVSAFGDLLGSADLVRAGRVSWGMVCISILSITGTYYLLRREAPCETG